MSVDPTSIISMIEQCIKIYDYIEAVRESSKERQRFMQEVAALRDVLVNLQGLLQDDAFTQNRSSMAPLKVFFDPTKPFVGLIERDLGELERKLRGATKKDRSGWRLSWTKVVAAGMWPLDKAESEVLFIRLERHKSLISLAMQHDIDRLIHAVLEMAADSKGQLPEVTAAVAELTQVIGVAISYEERRKVAEWISNVTFSAYHAENSRKWLEGTGGWVLESSEFQSWVTGTSSPPVLWCYGDAGAGKSVAAAMIVEHLRSIAGNIVLVIVCRYNQNHDSLRETHAFICCLLRQLLQLDATSSVPPSLLELYRKDIHPSEDGVRTLLIEAARLISRPIFIVLDALDECPLGFDLVAAIESLGHDFNLLITSRDVFSQIKDYPSLPIRAADRDILALVDSKISKLRWICEDEDLQSAVRSEVVARANGMFLLASLTLWELEHDVASKVDVRRVLTSIPVSLDDAYHQIFVRIGKQGARMKQLALQAIMWIYADFGNPVNWNKLYWWELRLVFACNMISMSGSDFPEPPSANTIVDACGGLVSAPRDVALAPAFIHYSVQEYIFRFRSSVFPEDPYEFAFKFCITALSRIEGPDATHLRKRLQVVWYCLAHILDSYQPVVVHSALADENFTKCLSYHEQIIGSLRQGDGGLTPLDYAAILGIPHTFGLAQEVQAPDERHFRRVTTVMIKRDYWDVVHKVWKCGDYDINIFCDEIGCTAACRLVTFSTFRVSVELCRSFIDHPSTSLCCPRHDSLLGCALCYWDARWWSRDKCDRALENIKVILERLSRDTTSNPYQPTRFPVYSPPSPPRSHPPDILDVIAVFLQRAKIDFDAHITHMVPPEILLALLMLPWHTLETRKQVILEVLRPYARRPVANVPDVSISDQVRNTKVLAHNAISDRAPQVLKASDICATVEAGPAGSILNPAHPSHIPGDNAHVVPQTVEAIEAKDSSAPAVEPVPADSTLAHIPSDKVFNDHAVSHTTQASGGVDTYRMTAVLLVAGAAISSLVYIYATVSASYAPIDIVHISRKLD